MGTAVVGAMVVVAAVLAVAVELFSGEFRAVARCGCSSVSTRPLQPSSSVSGTLVGVVAAAVVAVALKLFRGVSKSDRDRCRDRSEGGAVTKEYIAYIAVRIASLDYEAILTAMYALSASAEGDCSRCVPPDPGIAAAALGASESGTLPGTAPAKALHTFTLDSHASHCFFRDSTTLTPIPAPVPVRLADPSGGPVVARSSTVLPCPAVPSGSLSGLHLPSFTTNLVSTAALQDAMVTTTTPRGRRASICTCTRTRHHLAMFTRRPGSSLYTLATEPPQVAASAQVSASGLCHRLGHPSHAPPCLPCVKGRQRAAPHSLFPPTIAPPQTLHMDVWGPARVSGQGRERYFLLVVDDYTRYTMVFPLRSKGQVVDVLIPWICTVRLQLRERFGQDLSVLRLHSDRGGEFSSDLLRDFCCGEGILQSFTLPESPQQNGIAERRIGLVMEVARTSMIHAAAPHFLWPFAVRYAAHQLNLWPRVSLPETSPTLRWTGEVGDASVLRFYHPTSHRVLPSQDVTFDESVPFYRLFPYRSAPPPPPPLFLAPSPPPVDPLPPQGPAPSGMSQVDPLPGTAPVQVAVGSGATRGAASGGAASGGVELGGAGSEGAGSGFAGPGGEKPGGAESEGVESGGAAPWSAASSGGPAGASLRLSSQQLREWLVRRAHRRSGASGAGGAGDTGAGGAGVTAGAGGTGGTAATSPRCARASGAGADGTGCVGGAGAGGPMEPGAVGAGGAGVGGRGVEGAGAAGAGAVDPRARGAGGTVRPRPYFVPLLQQLASPLSAPTPYTEQSGGLTERREPASRPVLPVRPAHRVPRSRPPPVPGTHAMALRPSFVPLHVPLPAPPESSLPEALDPESDRARAASPTVSCLLATVVTGPSFESAAASALVSELLEFAAACRLDYTTALVAESASASPPSVEGECALGTDVLEDRQEDFECLAAAVPRFASMLLAPEGDPDAPDIPTPCSYAEAITGPYSSQWQAPMDAKMASWKSTGTYVDEVPPAGANIVDGMWIFRVKRPPGSPPAFKARYVARGFTILACTGAMLAHLPADRLGRAASFVSSSQRGQLRLAYVAIRANTAEIFTKALPPGSGGGQRKQQQRRSKTPSPQQLREWFAQRGASGGSVRCPYVIRTGDRAGQTCGKLHSQHCCFSRLDDAWRAEFGDEAKRPRWEELLGSGVDIFALDYDAILAAIYALSVSAEGDCYRCVPPDPGTEAAALGASESSLLDTAPVDALHTFTLDLGASRCFFRDNTSLIPLSALVPVKLADSSGGPVIARSSTVLPCPAVPSGSLSGLHLPSFSTKLVSTAALQDAMVSTTTPGGQRVSICTCPVAAPCSCRLLLHQTLLWHHHLGHSSLPRLRGMHSRLPRSLPPLPPSPAPPCLPCVEGRQRVAPHSSSFPPTIAPVQTLHMDVWGPSASVDRTVSATFCCPSPTPRAVPRGPSCSASAL
ncbi:unnamed protein product [Closterium sp. NIES-54]